MSRQRTVGDVLLEARAPYTHMDEDDSRLFYSTMNALLVYANNRLNVVSPQRLRARPGDPCMLYENGGRVSEELWKHRALVDDFVRENPLGLSERQLEAARPWRHALRDMFTVVDADADRAIYMNQDRLFVVGGIPGPGRLPRPPHPLAHAPHARALQGRHRDERHHAAPLVQAAPLGTAAHRPPGGRACRVPARLHGKRAAALCRERFR